jgi:3-hydroxyisobutyrate dehydrogenase
MAMDPTQPNESSSALRAPARIGFVGLGQMGLPMARSLARAGYRLVAYDTNAAALARARDETAAETPGSLREAGRECAALITMLPDGNAVRAVVLEALPGLASGSVVIDMSSSSPVGTRELGARLSQHGIPMLDAPVSGGARKAADASLSIMVGGDPQIAERCRPLFDAMGKQIFLTGPLGSGHAMKALNNYVSAAGMAAAIEAVLAGQRFGLDAKAMVDILNASTGVNNTTLNKFHAFILSRRFDAGFSLDLMVKDLKTAMEVAHATGSPVPLGEACLLAWTDAQKALGPGADHTAVARYWENLAGTELGKR